MTRLACVCGFIFASFLGSGDLLANVSTNDCDGSIRGVMPELRLGAPKYPASVDKMSGGIEIPPLC